MVVGALLGMRWRDGGFLYGLVQGFSLEKAGKIGAYALQRVEPVVSPKLTLPEDLR